MAQAEKKRGAKHKVARGTHHHSDDISHIIETINRMDTRAPGADIAFFDNVRKFFAAYLKMKHDLTYEEISEALSSRRIDAPLKTKSLRFVRKLPPLEYGGTSVGWQTLDELQNEFSGLVLSLSLVMQEQAQQKESKWDWLREAWHGIRYIAHAAKHAVMILHKLWQFVIIGAVKLFSSKRYARRLASGESRSAETAALSRADPSKIRERLATIKYLHSRHDHENVRKHYRELLQDYSRLSLPDRKRFHPQIIKLRYEIVSNEDDSALLDHMKNITDALKNRNVAHAKRHYQRLIEYYSSLDKEKQRRLYHHVRMAHMRIKTHSGGAGHAHHGISVSSGVSASSGILDDFKSRAEAIAQSHAESSQDTKKAYLELYDIYNSLDAEQKKQAYHLLQDARRAIARVR